MLLQCADRNGIFSSKAIDLLKQNINNYSIISIGNGMQKNNITVALVEQALKSDKKIVLDADALWAAQKNIELLKRSETTILTPHIKEMSDLTGIHVSTILSNPFEVARDFSKEYPSCILILKSSQTYIAHQGNVYVLDAQVESAKKLNLPYHVGVVQSKDSFFGQHAPETMPVYQELQNKWDAYCRLDCLASEMESSTVFIVGQTRHVRSGAMFLCLANQEREKAGLSNIQNHDLKPLMKCAVLTLKNLIQKDEAENH